ncbi:MAG TPA: glycerol-3-phosphate responsive antiterminator [Clostridiales bacterium]|jgi:glycerol-3-phosphate responsive antiterminator|nr:glycerol-3-phosphate responsive antiterminator [Clostridiales bacterium]
MNREELCAQLDDIPIIAAVKEDAALEKALESESKIIFLLYGTACTIEGIVNRVKEAGKYAFVHIDLVDGLSSKDGAIDFIRQYTKADGIISTKASQIKYARKQGLATIQRVFAIDSKAIDNIGNQVALSDVDMIEVMPGIIMPKVLKIIMEKTQVPVIAGGLIRDKEDVISALSAGVIAISTTKEDIWFM